MGISVIPQPSSAQSKKTQTITSSTTWTVPTGVNSVDVTCIGAGASIGGAGAVVKRTVDTSSLQGTGITVTVGASPAPNANGLGGNTSFGSFATAGGGFAGDLGGLAFAGMSGTMFDSSFTIAPSSTLVPFLSTYGEWGNRQSSIVYNSSIGLYVTGGNAEISSSSNVPPYNSGLIPYYTSSDGTTWTRRTFNAGLTNYIQGLGINSANNRLFFFYRSNTSVYYRTSSDGINWSAERLLNSSSTTMPGLAFNSSQNKYLFTISTGGFIQGWTVTTANVDTTNPSFEYQTTNTASAVSPLLTNGTSLTLQYLNQGGVHHVISYSSGGSWSNPTEPNFPMSNSPRSGAWDGSKLTVVTNNGNIWTTTNGTSYTNTSVTIPNLAILGYSGGYYYGSINNFFAHSTNGTTWTTTNIISSLTPSSFTPNIAANSTTFILATNVNIYGMFERFNIASPNTTIAKGFLGQGDRTSSNGLVNGGAGGIGDRTRAFDTSGTSYISFLTAPGVDGYGISTPLPPFSGVLNSTPLSFGSTNGAVGTQGAVILSWMQ